MKVKPLFLIGLLLCFFIFSVLALPLENFGDWTENNDPENKLVLSGANNESIVWTQVNRSDSCYYELNRTEPDFEIWFQYNVTELEAGDADTRNFMDILETSTLGGHVSGSYMLMRLRQSGLSDTEYYVQLYMYRGGLRVYQTSTNTVNVGQMCFVNATQTWNGTTTHYRIDVYSTSVLRDTGGNGDLVNITGADAVAGNHISFHYFLVTVGLNSGTDAGDYSSGIMTAFDFAPDPEITPPSFHYPFGLNSTLNGSICQFTVNFSDNLGLSHAFLSWNNSGTWANISLALSGTADLGLWNQTLNATSGLRIEYLFYVNDTTDNWNTTLQHFIYTNTKPIVLVVSDAGVLFIGVLIVFSLLGGIFILGKRKK